MQHGLTSKIYATTILVLLGVLLFIGLLRYKSAFFGAFILFVLFLPVHDWFTRRGATKRKATFFVLVLTLLVVLLPLMALIPAIIGQVSDVMANQDSILQTLDELDAQITQYDLRNGAQTVLFEGTTYLKKQLGSVVEGVTDFFITIVILYFVLYYLFANKNKLHSIQNYLPYKKENTSKLVNEFVGITKSTIFSSGIIALGQATIIGITMALLGIPGWLFWAFVTLILGFLPVIGTPLVWVPASIYLFASQAWAGGIIILVVGIFVSNADNFIRPILQEKIGKIHPLVSLIGIFIGVPLFGILGIVLGPLLISYFLMLAKIYFAEHIDAAKS